jgi:hypothetical protein
MCCVVTLAKLPLSLFMVQRGRLRSHRRPLMRVVLLIAISSIASQATAQVTRNNREEAALTVKVSDPQGAAIVTAQVQLNGDGKLARTAETDQHGLVTFTSLAPGKYRLHVEAAGFEHLDIKELAVKTGGNLIKLQLEIPAVREEVGVELDKREAITEPRGRSFTTVLTEEQIASLPDDPDQFDNALREMAGPGAVIRVNGFSGGKLPPKSQIREIRFRLNPYAAENHEAGLVGVDVFTKPGMDTWHGTFNFGFSDESLAARNAFAPGRGPEQYRRFGLTLDGPIQAKRTSLFLAAEGLLSFDSKTIVAALPDGRFADQALVPARLLNLSARVEHVLTKYHTLRAEYQRNAFQQNNLGVGNFDLPERAFSSHQVENLFRLSDTGPLGKRFVNEVRFQLRWQENELLPANAAPAIQVLNAFNRGGSQSSSSSRVRSGEFAENLDFALGKHTLKAGVLFNVWNERSDDRKNVNGTFTFSSLETFNSAQPVTFIQRVDSVPISFSEYEIGGYWQDDLRLHKSLSLSFGFRYEWQNNVKDRNNFAPRLGVVWSPFTSGKTTIRAGAGVFYSWLNNDTYEQTLVVDGQHGHDIVIRNPGFPDPLSGNSITVLPPSRIQRAVDLRMPYVEQFSFGVEQQLMGKYLLRATYMNQRGVHLLRGRNINAPLPGTDRRPLPGEGNVTQVESSANSWLDQFNVNLSPQMLAARRLYWLINYTWSRSRNEADGPLSLPADNFNLLAERGPAAIDSRHRLFIIANFKIFRDLLLGTVFKATSATPYNITTGFDDNRDTTVNDRPLGVSRNSARGDPQWDLSVRLSWSLGFGKAEPATVQGPTVVRSRNGTDALSALASGGNDKRYRTQFYLQIFNLFNHANLINFTGVQTSPFFNQATAALAGRRVEVGARFSF